MAQTGTRTGLVESLTAIAGKENVLSSPEDLLCYSYDATPFTHLPDVVVLPGNTAEVSAILRLANSLRIPVVARGAGTNLSGGAVPIDGGIVLLTRRMDQILEIDTGNLTATVQPGLVLADFHKAVEKLGLFYPPDPASLSVATLGGTIGEGAGGPRCLKYGTTRDYVIGLEVVLASGDVIKTGGKTVKNVSGYNMTHLFVGSEGTLGVVTAITVRLIPLPETKQTCLAIFDKLDDAAKTVSSIIASRIVPTTLELLDDVSMRLIEDAKHVGLPLDAEACLLIEVDGSALEVPRQIEIVADVCRKCGAREVKLARTAQESDALWVARRSAFAAMARARPTIVVEDATVPRQAVPEMVRAIKESAARHNIMVGLIAHAGDGNTHPQIMCDASDPDEMERVEHFTEEVFKEALRLGGTLSGEHGIGLLKARYLEWQFGKEGVAAMRSIKNALDPNNILNPGKFLG